MVMRRRCRLARHSDWNPSLLGSQPRGARKHRRQATAAVSNVVLKAKDEPTDRMPGKKPQAVTVPITIALCRQPGGRKLL